MFLALLLMAGLNAIAGNPMVAFVLTIVAGILVAISTEDEPDTDEI
jgi:hypothetical protein